LSPERKDNLFIGRDHMTSDGISFSDWDRVRELACEIVNTSSSGNDNASSEATECLLSWLDTLQGKYGELPSILATKADYIEDTSERLRLLKRAYELAEVRQDKSNLLLTASSLAEIYIAELADLENGRTWLETLEKSFGDSPSKADLAEFSNLKKKFEELKTPLQTP
jgi:hypothetical protein